MAKVTKETVAQDEAQLASDEQIVAGEAAAKPVTEETTTLGTEPVSNEVAAEQAKDEGAIGAGMPPAEEVKRESEALTHSAAEGFEPSVQEDLPEILEPVKPTVKVDLTKRELPAFHPEVATTADDHEDHERPAIAPEEIA